MPIPDLQARFTMDDTVPKKYLNAGLRNDPKPRKSPEAIDPFQSGGLGDNDALLVQPPYPPSGPSSGAVATAPTVFPVVLQRDYSHKNTVHMSLWVSFE